MLVQCTSRTCPSISKTRVAYNYQYLPELYPKKFLCLAHNVVLEAVTSDWTRSRKGTVRDNRALPAAIFQICRGKVFDSIDNKSAQNVSNTQPAASLYKLRVRSNACCIKVLSVLQKPPEDAYPDGRSRLSCARVSYTIQRSVCGGVMACEACSPAPEQTMIRGTAPTCDIYSHLYLCTSSL